MSDLHRKVKNVPIVFVGVIPVGTLDAA